MGILHSARLMVRRVGIDISPYPGLDPTYWLVRQLNTSGIDVVLDIGANVGRYARELRRAGYQKRIISFEPLSEPFSSLQSESAGDPHWDIYRCALGEANGTITVNVAANSGESSSVLPMLKTHEDAFPSANYIGTEEVQIHTLDSLAAELLRPTDKVFLKADVQGYEKSVLAGASSTLRDLCLGLQLELSLVPLYEGGMLYQDALDAARSKGFVLTGIIPGTMDPRNGRLLQADGIFFRED